MKVSDIQNQIDAFILNTLARTDSNAQDLCELLDNYLVQYRISLSTICARLNSLQRQHSIACLESAEPSTSATFCLTSEDLPLFALDDGMLEDFADQNDIPLYDDLSTDDVYLLVSGDDRWELHLMDEELELFLDENENDTQEQFDVSPAESNVVKEEANEPIDEQPCEDLPPDDELPQSEPDEAINYSDEEPEQNNVVEQERSDEENTAEQEAFVPADDEIAPWEDATAPEEGQDAVDNSDSEDLTDEPQYVEASSDEEEKQSIIETPQEEAPVEENESSPLPEQEAPQEAIILDDEPAQAPWAEPSEPIEEAPGTVECVQSEVEQEAATEDINEQHEIQEQSIDDNSEESEHFQPAPLSQNLEQIIEPNEEQEGPNTSSEDNDYAYEQEPQEDDKAYDFTYGEIEQRPEQIETQPLSQQEEQPEENEDTSRNIDNVVYEQISVFDEPALEPIQEEQPKEEPRKGKKKKEKAHEIEEAPKPEQEVMEPTPIEQQLAAEDAERRRVAMMRLGMLPGAEQPVSKVEQSEPVQEVNSPAEIPETPDRPYYYDSMRTPTGNLEQYLSQAEVEHKFMYHSILYNVFRDVVQKPQVEDDNSEVGLVTSITELREEMRKKGFVVNQYVAQNTYQYYSKKYILVNKINLVTSLITYILGLALILCGLFAVDPIVNWGWDKYVIAAVALLIFPAYRLISYLIYKDRHAPADYSFKFSFATSWMAAIILMMIDLLVAFFIPIPGTSANISVISSLIVPIFYPAALLLLLPIRSLIYFILYRTKRFHL